MDLWVSTRPMLSGSWGKAVNLGPAVNTPEDECHPSLTEDGLTMYFSGFWFPRKGSIGQSDIWVTKRRSLSDPWEIPTNLGANINSGYLDRDPFIAADGSFLLFCSRRPGGYNDDIWIAERTSLSGSFGKPVPLSSPVNHLGDDGGPFLSPDQSLLYFLSSRDDGAYRIWQVPILRKGQGIPISLTGQKATEQAK
jgi:Tol biopolymer transport system component